MKVEVLGKDHTMKVQESFPNRRPNKCNKACYILKFKGTMECYGGRQEQVDWNNNIPVWFEDCNRH